MSPKAIAILALIILIALWFWLCDRQLTRGWRDLERKRRTGTSHPDERSKRVLP